MYSLKIKQKKGNISVQMPFLPLVKKRGGSDMGSSVSPRTSKSAKGEKEMHDKRETKETKKKKKTDNDKRTPIWSVPVHIHLQTPHQKKK